MVELVKMLSQPHRNVWLAGDDDQSIHGFRGPGRTFWYPYKIAKAILSMERLIISYRKRQMGQPVTLASTHLGDWSLDGCFCFQYEVKAERWSFRKVLTGTNQLQDWPRVAK
jgi:hypothetical protein